METFTMSRKEVPRAGLVKAALAGKITNQEGARALRLTVRQFKLKIALGLTLVGLLEPSAGAVITTLSVRGGELNEEPDDGSRPILSGARLASISLREAAVHLAGATK
jgi:hypothetical protein